MMRDSLPTAPRPANPEPGEGDAVPALGSSPGFPNGGDSALPDHAIVARQGNEVGASGCGNQAVRGIGGPHLRDLLTGSQSR